MSLYVLDTDTLTLFQHAHPSVCRNAFTHPPADVAVTILSIQEQLSGWHARIGRAKKRDELARLYQRFTDTVRFLADMPILSFPEPAILRYEQLRALKLNVGAMDLRIAAVALDHGAAVVTRNRRDFQRIPGLAVEDWST